MWPGVLISGGARTSTIGAEGLGIPDPRLLIDRRRFRTTDSELRLRGYWGEVGWLAGLALGFGIGLNGQMATRAAGGPGGVARMALHLVVTVGVGL